VPWYSASIMTAIKTSLAIYFLTALSFTQTPLIKIISPIEHNPIITAKEVVLYGEIKLSNTLYFNNKPVKIDNGLFKIKLPLQSPGYNKYRLSAKNYYGTTNKDIPITTLKTISDIYVSPYKKEIEILYTLNILSAYMGTDFFKPNRFITKAEISKLLIKVHGLSPTDFTTKYYFKDLLSNHWSYEYIQTALNNKLLKPKEANFFGTESYISRKELANIIKPLISYNSKNTIKPFIDINYNNYEEKLLADIAVAGYFPKEWTAQNSIYPKKALTRAEVAFVFAHTDKLMKRIKNELKISQFLSPVKKNIGKSAKSAEITFSLINNQTFKIKSICNSEQKIAFIELLIADNYHTKNIMMADDGKGLDKIKNDQIFTSAINLANFNKQELKYTYKLFNKYNLIEEADQGKINFSGNNLSIY